MDKSIFKRHELKYLVNAEQRELIESAFEQYMVPDEHGESTICNIYYDTPDFRLIRRSLEKPVYKEKLRLRSYGTASGDKNVFLELKKKYKGIFAVIMGAANIILTASPFGETKKNELNKMLHITVPEDLEYAGAFDDIFGKYLSQYKMTQVKTTNLGSLNKLTYNITLGKAGCEKQMIDELRCRNGNLEINISSQGTDSREML